MVLCAGLGLLLEVASGRTLPGPLILPAGFVAATAIGGLITCVPSLAPLTPPVLAILAVAGLLAAPLIGPRELLRAGSLRGRGGDPQGSGRPGGDPGPQEGDSPGSGPQEGDSRGSGPRRRLPAGLVPATVAALIVFLVYGAPVILSGEPGFAGYIKLDDTSTWLAFTDQVLTNGHSVAGLAPSSYEATVQINLSAGYPLGAFVPLGVASRLAGIDPAWSFQPYLAVMAALMALVFFELARPVLRSPWPRAFAALIAAQAPLLVGYAWWGGIKEIATALIAATLAAGLATALPRPDHRGDALRDGIGTPGGSHVGSDSPGSALLRRAVPFPALAGVALIGVMGAGGAPWIAALLGGAALLAVIQFHGLPPGRYLFAGLGILIGILAVGLPTLFASGHLFSPSQGPLTSGEEMGNLIAPLKLAQYPGPWPVGDFRLTPDSGLLTAILVAATLVAAGFGVWAAVRSRAGGLLLAAGGITVGSLVVWLVGSPWIQGKALATGTAGFLLLATVGIAALLTEIPASGRPSPGETDVADDPRNVPGSRNPWSPAGRFLRVVGVILLIVPAGVLASNAMAYSHSWLAPQGQLAELEEIGSRFAGQGPALMTEYQPYGVRHFLRRLDAEGASELRRRQIPLRNGSMAEKGAWADTDQLALSPAREGLFTYRTLVLRRSPDQSRPPSPYSLAWRGRYYEVWQLPAGFDPGSVLAHLPLGSGHQPAGIPPCTTIVGVASRAAPGGRVIAAERKPNATAELTSVPPDWIPDPAAGTLTPLSDGTATGRIEIPAAGRYRVWIGGSVRGRVEVRVGGITAGSARGQLNNNRQYIELGTLDLPAGSSTVTVSYERGAPLRPATRDYPFGIGPVVVEPVGDPKLIELPWDEYDRLCGRRLDWIEAIR